MSTSLFGDTISSGYVNISALNFSSNQSSFGRVDISLLVFALPYPTVCFDILSSDNTK